MHIMLGFAHVDLWAWKSLTTCLQHVGCAVEGIRDVRVTTAAVTTVSGQEDAGTTPQTVRLFLEGDNGPFKITLMSGVFLEIQVIPDAVCAVLCTVLDVEVGWNKVERLARDVTTVWCIERLPC